MFTGIIEALGTVESLERRADTAVLRVRAGAITQNLAQGGSLAVNGVCLTATRPAASAGSADDGLFVADLIGETLDRTGLGTLRPDSRVNLERCLPAGGRFDGHIVQGHVDGTGRILALTRHSGGTTVRVGVPADLAPLLAEKGSIALDGISLTVTAVSEAADPAPWFEVGIIPATLAATTLGTAREGDVVNLETDAVAKYLARARAFETLDAPVPDALITDVQAGQRPVQETEVRGLRRGGLDPVERAVEAIAAGGLAVVVDDENRENEGDLIGAAALADPERLGFMIRWSSGVVCAPMTGQRAEALRLPPMVEQNEDPKGTAYTVTCDAVGTGTGISSGDRALTLNVLADARSEPADLSRPGHVLPLRAVDGGVAERPGHTEAAVELARAAGLPEVGYIAELVHDDGSMMRFDALREFADAHGLPMISIEDLIAWLDDAGTR